MNAVSVALWDDKAALDALPSLSTGSGPLRDLILVEYDAGGGNRRTSSILFTTYMRRFPEGDQIKISVSKRDPSDIKLDRLGWLNHRER